MGSNMQRQAVPLMVTQQPIVATGMEYKAATDSGTAVLAKNDGIVEKMDADHVVVRNTKGELEDYALVKFARSNAGTCINQRPIVEVGESVKAGQVLADGPAMRNGEISSRLPGRMRPPRLCCGIKHTKSEILPPHAPQSICFYLLSLFSPGACPPLPGGCRAAKRPSGRERNPDAPQEGACISAMRPIKST